MRKGGRNQADRSQLYRSWIYRLWNGNIPLKIGFWAELAVRFLIYIQSENGISLTSH